MLFAQEFRLLTYNTFLLRPPGIQLWGHHEDRLKMLPQVLGQYHIVGLTEVFSQADRDDLLRNLRSTHSHHEYVKNEGVSASLLYNDAGLLLLSSFPTVKSKSRSIIYQNRSFLDRFLNKGALYTQIKIGEGKILQIVMTHLQGRVGDRHHRIRRLQLQELAQFIQSVYDPAHPLVVMGDFNIDENWPEYDELVRHLNGGRDLYRSVQEDPGYTVNGEENTLADEERKLRIDYIFLKDTSGKINVLDAKVQKFPVSQGNHSFDYLSDHFGVESVLRFID